jgi:hypothetical protein
LERTVVARWNAEYRKAWSLLRPGGHLAFREAVHVEPESGADPFFREIQ